MNHEESVELAVVAQRAGVRIALVRRYLEFGLFEPRSEPAEAPPRPEPAEPPPRAEPAEAPRYDPHSAARIARAERLRRDLGLNLAGAVLVCELLDRIRELEARQ
jgi:DNA-binding transcriptional MerR regulator